MYRMTCECAVITYVTWTVIILTLTQGQQQSQLGHHCPGLSARVMGRFKVKRDPSIHHLGG